MYRSYVACTVVATLEISSPYLETFALLTRYFLFLLLKYKSNIGAVSGYHRFKVVINLEKLVVDVIVIAVFFANAILLVSVVEFFASIFDAIIVVAVVTAAAVVLLVVAAVAVAVISTFVAAVAAAALCLEMVRRRRSFLFCPV